MSPRVITPVPWSTVITGDMVLTSQGESFDVICIIGRSSAEIVLALRPVASSVSLPYRVHPDHWVGRVDTRPNLMDAVDIIRQVFGKVRIIR